VSVCPSVGGVGMKVLWPHFFFTHIKTTRCVVCAGNGWACELLFNPGQGTRPAFGSDVSSLMRGGGCLLAGGYLDPGG
jgi:hypothetical protein